MCELQRATFVYVCVYLRLLWHGDAVSEKGKRSPPTPLPRDCPDVHYTRLWFQGSCGAFFASARQDFTPHALDVVLGTRDCS